MGCWGLLGFFFLLRLASAVAAAGPLAAATRAAVEDLWDASFVEKFVDMGKEGGAGGDGLSGFLRCLGRWLGGRRISGRLACVVGGILIRRRARKVVAGHLVGR